MQANQSRNPTQKAQIILIEFLPEENNKKRKDEAVITRITSRLSYERVGVAKVKDMAPANKTIG